MKKKNCQYKLLQKHSTRREPTAPWGMLWWEKLAYNANTVRTSWKQRSLLKETWPALKGESDPEAAGLSGLLDRVKVSRKAAKETFMLVELFTEGKKLQVSRCMFLSESTTERGTAGENNVR